MNIEKIAAVFGNQAVHQGHPGTQADQTTGKRGSDKAESPSNENLGIEEDLLIERHELLWSNGVLNIEIRQSNDNLDHAITARFQLSGTLPCDSRLQRQPDYSSSGRTNAGRVRI